MTTFRLSVGREGSLGQTPVLGDMAAGDFCTAGSNRPMRIPFEGGGAVTAVLTANNSRPSNDSTTNIYDLFLSLID